MARIESAARPAPSDTGAPSDHLASFAAADHLDVIRRYDQTMYEPNQIAYFEESGFCNFGYWTKQTSDPKAAAENLVEELLARVPDRSGRVLDVACGKGATTRFLSRYWPVDQVFAINLSEKQLGSARATARGSSFVMMDAARLGFADAAFRTLVCVEAAFHFDTRQHFLGEALRVLEPGGTLVLSDILMTSEAEARRPYRRVENYVSGPAEYASLLERVGFVDVEVADATVPCWEGTYWAAVEFAHRRLLGGVFDVAQVRRFLELTYRKVGDMRWYVLVAARKAGTT